ncbi:hypothetical protein BCR44DRAFT_1481571 [Catenaria anguillulae PL171]|uniref:Tyrosinase copper-binding domain-containing protein n=1 Tax=Catenaria anguillulae PL171 TaxID=765915 RepID=A0A1Y2I5X2_9FUNG|nr:hypothetical protein BCR44DRAFT_1481571 [Catenaria anguillulae PL171]
MTRLFRFPLLAILAILVATLSSSSVHAQQQPPVASSTTSSSSRPASTATSTTSAVAPTRTATASQPATQSTQQPPQPTQPAVEPRPESILVMPRRGNCRRQCVRKEVSRMSTDEWNRFANAVRELNRGQGGSQMTPYERLVQEHLDQTPAAHGVDAFFPWHRYYLARFEQSLQAIDASVCLPYWDWSRTSQNYRGHQGAFSQARFGSPSGGCVNSASFPNWNTRQSGGQCVRRNFSGNRLTAVQFVAGIMRGSPNYSDFRPRYEAQCHGGPHVAIGGVMGNMASPSDPIFWLHHAIVDKHLADYWEFFRGGAYPNPGERLAGWPATAGDMTSTRDWCYVYEDSPFPEETNPQQPSGLPDSWLRMAFGDNATAINSTLASTNTLLNQTEQKIANNDTADLLIPKRGDSVNRFDRPGNSAAKDVVGLASSVVAAVVSIAFAM